MRRSWRIAFVVVVAIALLGSAIFGVFVRTYTVGVLIDSAFAIWNDEQLVVFVQEATGGTSATVLQQLMRPAVNRSGIPALTARHTYTARTDIFRVEHGEVLPPIYIPRSERDALALAWEPRFVEGRPLLFGGFWNGRQIEMLDVEDYLCYMRSPKVPADDGRWHSGWPPAGPTASPTRATPALSRR